MSKLEVTGSLEEIMKQLDGRFFKCSEDCAVNIDNIAAADIDGGVIYMIDGHALDVDLDKRMELKRLLLARSNFCKCEDLRE